MAGRLRVRGISMCQALGPGDWLDPAGFQANVSSKKKYRVYYKTSDIINPGPAMCWVFSTSTRTASTPVGSPI